MFEPDRAAEQTAHGPASASPRRMSRPDPTAPTHGSGSFRSALAARARAAVGSPAARQGSWTIVDQALFSGSTFVVNVRLARWLAPAPFGAFATALVFLVAGDEALRARLGTGGQARIDAALRVEHVAAHALTAYDDLDDAPHARTSDGASVPLHHVGLVRCTG